jgi:HEAT repeat protein
MSDLSYEPPEEVVRRWWYEGDEMLRRHALLSMAGFCCSDIVRQTARDPGHPLQTRALWCMQFFFDRPEDEAIKIAALQHPDSEVRELAAWVLLWDEPVYAEDALLDATHDSVVAVVAEAANTLEYYPTRRVLRRMHELLEHPDEKVQEAADDSFESIRGSCLHHLRSSDPRIATHFRRWLRPVWGLLDFTEDDLAPYPDEPTQPQLHPLASSLPFDQLLTLLRNPDSSPRTIREVFAGNGWLRYTNHEREELREVLLTHPDQLIRYEAPYVLSTWSDMDGLLGLLRDAIYIVRKSAMYNLGLLPPQPELAEVVWEYLHLPTTLGVHAWETLSAFVRHADRAVAVPRLAALAADREQRENIRWPAIHDLMQLAARDEIAGLVELLQKPPPVTWALHIALLDAITELELPAPDVGWLYEVDNFDVQRVVAELA